MAENVQRNRGRGTAYKFDKGGVPSEFGPFIGIIKSSVDSTRAGRLRVYIEAFGGENPDDESNWRTVNYLPHFYGATEHAGGNEGTGNFIGNRHTYGMWFTPPDIGTRVFCFFADGDPNQGYYTGCVPDPGLGHMIPGIAGSPKFDKTGTAASAFYSTASSVPVTEINGQDPSVFEDSRFWDRAKPIHSTHAYSMFQQGLINDTIRGPISSSSQRESPSSVFGVSTPGKPVYAGGFSETDIKSKLEKGEVTQDQIKVIGRRGGHTLVMDDGDLEGNDQLIRIRTAKGHQITMSDDGNCFYITHANGQSWLEFGAQGTVDVFSTNSVNVRTQGTINLHADKDINMYAGKNINMLSKQKLNLESTYINNRADGEFKAYSKAKIMMRSDQVLALDAGKTGSFDGGDNLALTAGCIALNSGGSTPVSPVTAIPKNKVSDSSFDNSTGWKTNSKKLETIATRVPTHEPYPFHNLGVENSVSLGDAPTSLLPTSTQLALNSATGLTPNGIVLSEFTAVSRASNGIETLNSDQVTGIMGQLAKDTGQRYNEFSVNKGIGEFGLSAEQLESAGYLTPGTTDRFLTDPSSTTTDEFGNTRTQLERTLASSTVWTNKGGVQSLTSFLNNKSLQETAVQDLYSTNISQLRANGVVKGTESPVDLGAILNASVSHGVDNTVKWAKNEDVPTTIANGIKQTARNAQYAVKFVDEKITPDLSGFGSPGGYSGTTDRAGIDAAGNALINNDKIPKPKY